MRQPPDAVGEHNPSLYGIRTVHSRMEHQAFFLNPVTIQTRLRERRLETLSTLRSCATKPADTDIYHADSRN